MINQVEAETGEEIETARNGVRITDPRPTPRSTVSAQRWRELLDTAPAIDDDFSGEVMQARAHLGPPSGAWPSWIGATALAHGYAVATANARDFERIPGLTVIAVRPDR